jgi:hypothetical protein
MERCSGFKIQKAPVTEHTLEERVELHRRLLKSDDVTLFTQGGCHVFALALHERFNYPVHYIPGTAGNGVSHIYCRFVGPTPYAVDVLGFTPEDDRIWKDFGSPCRNPPFVSLTQLRSFFKPLTSDDGMCGEEWFVCAARQRADRRIEEFIDIFSGTRQERIQGLVRKLL